MERKTGFEPATPSLARRCSTTEPLPLAAHIIAPQSALARPRFLTLEAVAISLAISVIQEVTGCPVSRPR